MRYTVLWMRSAEDHLADLWVRAQDRQAVARAADRIERLLRDDPEERGIPYEELWKLIEPPLGVFYGIDEGDRKVRIVEIQLLEGPKE